MYIYSVFVMLLMFLVNLVFSYVSGTKFYSLFLCDLSRSEPFVFTCLCNVHSVADPCLPFGETQESSKSIGSVMAG